MISLFKKIRHDLLTKNKFSKYLLYAIGEIILVVLGILMALQINNRNELQKDEIRVNKYLVNLSETLADDIASLEANISFNKTRLKGVFYILEHAGLNTQTFTEIDWIGFSANDENNFMWNGSFPDTMDRNFTNLSFSLLGRGFGGISLNKSVVNELYSTGAFSNIQNPNLKSSIGNYYSYLAKRLEGFAIEEHEEWANETTRFLRDQYGIFTLDVSDLENPIALLEGKKDAEHHLRYLALEINYHCVWASVAKEKASDLIVAIENELSRI